MTYIEGLGSTSRPGPHDNGGLSLTWWTRGYLDLLTSLVGDHELEEAVEVAVRTAAYEGVPVGTAVVAAVVAEIWRQNEVAARG